METLAVNNEVFWGELFEDPVILRYCLYVSLGCVCPIISLLHVSDQALSRVGTIIHCPLMEIHVTDFYS